MEKFDIKKLSQFEYDLTIMRIEGRELSHYLLLMSFNKYSREKENYLKREEK
jgi:hypothetical protein